MCVVACFTTCMATSRPRLRPLAAYPEELVYKENNNHGSRSKAAALQDWASEANPVLVTPRPSANRSEDDRLEEIIRMLLVELGVDTNTEHFCNTPARVARFYREFTSGYTAHPADILKTFHSQSNGLVVVSCINFFSLCPHHLLIYGGKIHFGYVPDGQIVGVSKIPRLIHALAARLVVQEDLVADVADTFMAAVKPLGCAVKAIGQHDCIAVRGVRCPFTMMTTVVTRGIFQEKESLCREFDQAIEQGAKCVR